MGSLSPGVVLSIGSAIGQVTEVQPSASNFLLWSIDAQQSPWTSSGGIGPAAFGSVYVINQFPVQDWSAPGPGVGRREQPVITTGVSFDPTSNRYVASIYAGISLDGVLLANPSQQLKLGFSGEIAAVPFDFNMTFNPSNGQIINANSDVSVTSFEAEGDEWFRASLYIPRNLFAATNRIFYVENALQGAAANVYAFAPQLEAVALGAANSKPSDAIPTTDVQVTRQPSGIISRTAMDSSVNTKIISSATYTILPTDYANLLVFTGNCTITLPNRGDGQGELPSGFWCKLSSDPTFGSATVLTVTADAAAEVIYPGCGVVAVGNSVSFPSVALPGVSAVTAYMGQPSEANPARWQLLDTTTPGNASVNLNGVTGVLGAQVNLNNTANFFTGPTVTVPADGDYLVVGQITVSDTTGGINTINVVTRINGTTIFASGRINLLGTGTNIAVVPQSGIVTVSAGDTIAISARDITTVNGVIQANVFGGQADSSISIIKIA